MIKRIERITGLVSALLCLLGPGHQATAQTIAAADLQIQGSGLRVVTTSLTTGIDVPFSIQTEFGGKQNDAAPIIDGLIAAGELTGPGLDAPIQFRTAPGHAFHLPGLPVAGTYLFQNIRLMRADIVLQSALPSLVAITVTNLLSTSVRVRQLTPEEIRARGINVDPSNYDVYEYTFSFLVDGQTVEIPFPVIIDPRTHDARLPSTGDPYRLPPDTLAVPPRWNSPTTIPIELYEAGPAIPEPGAPPPANGSGTRRSIPAALVIPNEFAILHQFFAVTLAIHNDAAEGSNVRLDSIEASMTTPSELRTVKTTPSVTFGTAVPIVDSTTGMSFLAAQAQGNAEWVMEGLKPGTHTVTLDIRATLRTPGQPDMPLHGSARASVVVHDPRFNVTFSHPGTVRKGVDYSTFSFITNLSGVPQTIRIGNGVQSCVQSPAANVCRVDGPDFDDLTLGAGETKSILYHLRAGVSGTVFATAGTVDNANLTAALQLSMGVSESGIPLSPATLVLPYYAGFLDPAFIEANMGLLGLGYSLATAPLTQQTAALPRVVRSDVFQRAVDISRAGQRRFLGAEALDVWGNLTLDLLGNGKELGEWDQLRRTEDAGRLAGDGLARRIENEVLLTASDFSTLAERFAALTAHRSPYFFASLSGPSSPGITRPYALSIRGRTSAGRADTPNEITDGRVRDLPFADIFGVTSTDRLRQGEIAMDGRWKEDLDVEVTPAMSGALTLDVIFPAAADGNALLAHFDFNANSGRPLHVAVSRGAASLTLIDSSGAVVATATASPVAPVALKIISARQDQYLDSQGHEVSVLFSRPVTVGVGEDLLSKFSAGLDFQFGGVDYQGPRSISAAAIQEDGRIVNLTFDHVLSKNVPDHPPSRYAITTSALIDPLTNQPVLFANPTTPIIENAAPAGIVFGRVLEGDNSPVADAEVVLSTGGDLQIDHTGSEGTFLFEAVPRDPNANLNGAYTLRATTSAGRATSLDGAVRLPGQVHVVNLLFLGRGRAEGVVRYENGTLVANARVVVGSTLFNQLRQTTTDASGFYAVDDLPAGPLTFSATDALGNVTFAASEIRAVGELIRQDLSILRTPFPGVGTIRGVVIRSDSGATVAGARVGVYTNGYGINETTADAAGRFAFSNIPAGLIRVLAADFTISPESAVLDLDLARDQDREVTLTLVVSPSTQPASLEGDVFREDPFNPGDSNHYQKVPGAIVSIDRADSALADSNGHYRFAELPLSFSGRQVRAFDPATGLSATVAVPSLDPSTVHSLLIVIRNSPGKGTVRVRLLSATGAPVSGYRILEPGFPPLLFNAVDNGVYELQNVPVGASVSIRAVPPLAGTPYGDQFASGNAAIAFAGQVLSVVLRLPGQGTVRVKLASDIDVIGDVDLSYQVWDEAEQSSRAIRLTRSTSENGVAGFASFNGIPALQPYSVASAHPVYGYASASGQLGFDGDAQTLTLQLARLATVRGTVFQIDGVTPVAGASVSLADGTQNAGTRTTALDGSFEFQNVAAGRSFRLTATATRNAIFRTGVADGSTPPTGGLLDNIRIVMRREGRIEGRVVFASLKLDPTDATKTVPDNTPGDLTDNAPVPLARFFVKEIGFPSRDFGTPVDPLTADAGGRFSIGNIFEGPVRVSASDPANPDLRGDWTGTLIAEGEQVSAYVGIAASGFGTVTITVVDPDNGNAPVVNAEVRLARNGASYDLTSTNSLGLATFVDVPAGTYTASAYASSLGRSGGTGPFMVVDIAGATQTISLQYSGAVDGKLVDPEAAGAGVAGAQITLTSSSFETRASTGVSGDFTFDGVREGTFSLFARDPQSDRRATATSSLSPSNPRPFVNLELEPTETLYAAVFLPNDGGGNSGVRAPLVQIDARQLCTIVSFQNVCAHARELQGNDFRISGMLAREPYRVEVRELGGLERTTAVSAAFPRGSSAEPLVLVLPAFGGVRVHVTQGGVPATNAHVTVSGGGRLREGFSDSAGTVLLTGIPLGGVSAQAVSVDGGLNGSAGGTLSSQTSPELLSIELGSYATVSGSVESESGGPSIGTRVIANFGISLETLTNEAGRFSFGGIPVALGGTPVSLTYLGGEDATVGGLQTVNIAAGTRAVEAPPIRLDATPPRVVSISPADGSANVSPDASVFIAFSEAIRPEQLNGNLLQLVPADGTAVVNTTIASVLASDGSEIVTLSPPPPPAGQRFPLRSNTLYRLIISGQITDRTGHPLSAPSGASFITSDYVEPRVVKVIPSVLTPLQPATTFEFQFSKAIDPAPWQSGGAGQLHFYQLDAFGPAGRVVGEKSGRTFLGNGNRSLFFAPDAPLDPESFYRIVFSGIRDSSGNTLAEQTFNFFSRDTTRPFVNLIAPVPAGQPLIAGRQYTVAVDLRNGTADGTGAVDVSKVDYYRVDGDAATFVGSVSVSPFSYQFVPPAGATGTTLTLRAIATDRSLNMSDPAQLTWNVVSDAPPSNLRMSLTPADSTYAGKRVHAQITFEDEGLLVSVQGALSGTQSDGSAYATSKTVEVRRATNGDPWVPAEIDFDLPPTLKGASQLSFTAHATDSSGNSSADVAAQLMILEDTTAPVLTIVSPGDGAVFQEGAGNTITVRASAADAETGLKSVTAEVQGSSPVAMVRGDANDYSAVIAVPFVDGADPVSKTITVAASDYVAHITSKSIAVRIQPLADPNAPVVGWMCGSEGAMEPAGYTMRLRVSAMGNSVGNSANPLQTIEFLVDGIAQPIVATAVAGVSNQYEGSFTIPSGAIAGDTFVVRGKATNVAGITEQTSTTITVVNGRTIGNDTTISPSDLSWDDQTLIVQSGTASIDGPHRFVNLVVLDGAVVTHSATQISPVKRLDLTAERIYVACSGSIDAGGRGYSDVVAGQGRTWPGVTTGGSAAGVGGSHGGQGGAGGAVTYGSLFDPDTPGAAGGGQDCTNCNGGGGVVLLDAGVLVIDGAIQANGSGSVFGSGAGGSVNVRAVSISGTGQIHADGGRGSHIDGLSFRGTGGGGGRIAIRYQRSAFDETNISASGGDDASANSAGVGGAGTIYIKPNSAPFGSLRVANTVQSTMSTTLMSIGPRTADATTGSSVHVAGANFPGPDHLSGVRLVLNGDRAITWPVISNDEETLRVDTSSNALTIAAGQAIRGLDEFDAVTLRNAHVITNDFVDSVTGIDKDPESSLVSANLAAPAVDLAKISIVVTTVIRVTGLAGAVSDPDTPVVLTARNNRTSQTWTTAVVADGSFSVDIQGQPGDVISVRATDSHPFPLSTVFMDIGSIAGNDGPPLLDAAKIAIAGKVVTGVPGAVSDPDVPVTVGARNDRTLATYQAAAAADGSFSIAVDGGDGDAISLIATDSNPQPLSSARTVVGNLPHNAGPPTVDTSRIKLEGKSVVGSAGSIVDSDLPVGITLFNDRTGAAWTPLLNADGSFAALVDGNDGDGISLVARDGHLFPLESPRTVVGAISPAASATQIDRSLWTSDPAFLPRRVVTDGTTLAVTSYPNSDSNGASGTVVLLDLTTPASPSLKQSPILPKPVRSAAVLGDYAYFGTTGDSSTASLYAVQISTGTITQAPPAGNLFPSVDSLTTDGNRTLFAGIGSQVVAFDLAAPVPLAVISSANMAPSGRTFTSLLAWETGRVVGVASGPSGSGFDLVVMDWTPQTGFTRVGELDIPNFEASDAAAFGNELAVVSRSEAELVVVDLTDPTSPVVLGRRGITSPSGGIDSIENDAFLAAGGSGLAAADLTSGGFAILGYTSLAGPANDAALIPNYAYVADETGLAIVSVRTAPAIDTSRITLNYSAGSGVVRGQARSVLGLASVTVALRNSRTSAVVSSIPVSPDGSFTSTISAEGGDEITLQAIDGGGKTAGPVSVGRVPFGATTATAINPAVAGAGFRGRALAMERNTLIVSDTAWADQTSSAERLLQFDVSNPARPFLKRTVVVRPDIYSVALKDGWALIGDSYGLETIDLNDPASVLESPPDTGDLFLDGAILVLGDFALTAPGNDYDGRIRLYDISNPASPRFLKDQSGFSHGIYTQLIPYGNDYLLGLDPDEHWGGDLDLVVFDRRDLGHLQKVGELSIPLFSAFRGAVSDHILYAAGLDGKLAVIDLSDPFTPQLRKLIETPGGSPRSVLVEQQTLWIADDAAGLTKMSIQDPLNPVLVGSQSLGGPAWDLASDGTALYVANETGLTTVQQLSLLPVLSPALVQITSGAGATVVGQPHAATGTTPLTVELKNVSTSAAGTATVAGDGSFTVSVAAGQGDVLQIALIDSASLRGRSVALGPFSTASETAIGSGVSDAAFGARTVERSGTSLVVTDESFPLTAGSDKLLLYDIATSTAPSLNRTVTVGNGVISDVKLANGWAFVADRGISTINVLSGAASPAYSSPVGSYAQNAIALQGNSAFLSGYGGDFTVFDVSNPASPALTKRYSSSTFPLYGSIVEQLLPLGSDYLVALTRQTVYRPFTDRAVVLDRRDLNAISVISELSLPDLTEPKGAVNGTMLYLIDQSAEQLIVIDLSTPAAPVIRGRLTLPANGQEIAVTGSTLRIACGFAGLVEVDSSDPDSPRILSITPTHAYAWDAATTPEGVYVTNGKGLVFVPAPSPPLISLSAITLQPVSASVARVSGSAQSVIGRIPLTVQVVNVSSGATASAAVAADGSFGVTVAGTAGQALTLKGFDREGLFAGPFPIGTIPPFGAALEIHAGSVSLTKTSPGILVVTGAPGAVTGEGTILASIGNQTTGASVSNLAVAADGSFSGTISALTGAAITLSATNGTENAGPIVIGTAPPDPFLGVAISASNSDADFRGRRLAASGDRLLVSSYPDGGTGGSDKVLLLDVSIPTAPALTATVATRNGPVNDVLAANGWAFVASNSLSTFPLNQSSPSVISFSDDDAPETALAISGTLLFAAVSAAETTQIHVWDVTNPAAPRFVASNAISLSTMRISNLMTYGDDYLIAISPSVDSTGEHDVSVIDRRDSNDDWISASLAIPGIDSFRGKIVGSMLYIAGLNGRLATVDLENPAAPRLIGAINTQSGARGIDLTGSWTGIAEAAGVETFDTTSTAAPRTISLEPTSSPSWDVLLHHGALFVASDSELRAYASSAPPAIDVTAVAVSGSGGIATITGGRWSITGTPPLQAAVQSSRSITTASAVVAANGSFVTTLPATSGESLLLSASGADGRTSTTRVGVVPFITDTTVRAVVPADVEGDLDFLARKVTANDDYVVVSGGFDYFASNLSGRLLLFAAPNATSPAPPRVISAMPESWINDITLQGHWLFVSGKGIAAIDLSSTTSVPLRTVSQDYTTSITVDTAHLFAASGGDIAVYDISALPSIVESGSQSIAPGYFFNDVLLFGGDYLVALSSSAADDVGQDVTVIDRHNPNALAVIGKLDIPGFEAVNGLIDGSTLYATGDYYDYPNAVAVVDLSDPVQPRFMRLVQLPGAATGMAITSTNELLVANGASGLTFLDIADLTNPILLGSQKTPGNAVGVTVAGNSIFVATEEHLFTLRRP